jgi:hypothetical protein
MSDDERKEYKMAYSMSISNPFLSNKIANLSISIEEFSEELL